MKILMTMALILILSGPAFADDSELRYNYMEDSWSYESSQNDLKYNPMEDHWSYEDPDSELKYNFMEDRWEWSQ